MRDYTQQLTIEQFGAMVPTATRTVGSLYGPYIGYTPAGVPRPVRFDCTQAPREDRASGVLLLGTLGSGKTVTAQKLALDAERRGSLIVDFDPKPDHGWEQLPELNGRLQILELSGDPSQQGVLDPLTIGLEEYREELACSYLLELLPGYAGVWESAVAREVRATVKEGSQSLRRVVQRLAGSEDPDARRAGEALEVISDIGLGRLGFADKQTSASTVQQPVTTIRMPGLSLPDPGAARETYTRSERISVATLSLVAAYALRLISNDRSRHKIVNLDEAWFLLASAQGRQVISRLILQGRAFNATVFLGAHLLPHIGDLAQLLGVKFLFGQDSEQAAAAGLELIGREPTRDLISRVCGYRKGRCLMCDLDRRVEEVQIDLVYPHLLAGLTTTPQQAGQQ
jgi:hypothetical protein